MKFRLEHDWQGNMASPRKHLGEKTKLHFFLILSFVWIFTGLTGHEPYRPLESTTISQILEIIQHNQFIHPSSASNEVPYYPPLYAFFGAAFETFFFVTTSSSSSLSSVIPTSLNNVFIYYIIFNILYAINYLQR